MDHDADGGSSGGHSGTTIDAARAGRGVVHGGIVLACFLAVILAGSMVAFGAAADGSTTDSPGDVATAATLASDHVNECAATPPGDLADPEGSTNDTIGWVDGFWYNETLDIESNPLTRDQVENLARRTAARVEAIRCMAYDEIPPLEMVTRDEYRDDLKEFFDEELDENDRLFENARLSTLLLVGQDEEALDVQLETQASFPAAFYDTDEEYMGFVTNDSSSIDIDQTTLAHELTHALQDQNFDLDPVFEQPTNDDYISSLSVVEGEADLVEQQYNDACQGGDWASDCLNYQGPFDEPPSWGITLNQLAAYHTPLVEHEYDEEGWEGVSNLFEDMPDSMVESLDPEKYGSFERADIPVEDRSTGDWRRLNLTNQTADVIDYDIIGKHGLTSIFVAPTYAENFIVGQGLGGTSPDLIDIQEFFPAQQGGNLNYGHPVTSGWQSDRLYGYANGENQTGSVWRLAWESESQATDFGDTFEGLVEYRNGSQSEDYSNVYTFEDSDSYDMALGMDQQGTDLYIVTAPTVDDLTDVHQDFELVEASNDGSDGEDGTSDGSDGDMDDGSDGEMDDGSDGETDDGADAGDGNESDDEESADDGGAGFGVVIAVVAGLGAIVVFRVRARQH